MNERWDETWHRLREWTNGQGQAERLAGLVLLDQGYTELDPSHPLGGPDGGKDGVAAKNGEKWVMAVYLPRGQQSFNDIKTKFLADHQGVAANEGEGLAFVTNQELRLSEREELKEAVDTPVDLFHLERVNLILDQPRMHPVRAQFLGIDAAEKAEPRNFRQIIDSGAPPPGAPDHRMAYDGSLFLQVVAVPVAAETRHPKAADPRAALEAASKTAADVAASWPDKATLLPRRLAEGWEPMKAHHWGAGRTWEDPEKLARHNSAAASFVTTDSAMSVERTWATAALDDYGEFAFHAAREPEVVAELMVALKLAGALLQPLPESKVVDVAVLLAAGSEGMLVSSERSVSGNRFGQPAGHLENPVADAPTHYNDSARVDLGELLDPSLGAQILIGPWLAMFRSDDLFAVLREGGS